MTLCLLPNVERRRSMASSSSVATRSTENGWSFLPALYDPVRSECLHGATEIGS